MTAGGLVSGLFFFAPGVLLFKALFGKGDWDLIEQIFLCLCLVLVFLFPFMIVGTLFRLMPSSLWGSFLFFEGVLFLFLWLRRTPTGVLSRDRLGGIWIWILLFICSLFSAWRGGILSRDAFTFLAFIRKVAELPRMLPNDPFYGSPHPDPVYGYNIWLFALGFLTYLLGMDAVSLWKSAPIVLGPMALAAFYFLCRSLWKNALVANVGALLFVLCYGVYQKGWIFRVIEYPNVVGNFLLLPVGVGFFFRYLSEGKRRHLAGVGMSGLLLAATHPFCFVLWVTSLFLFGVGDLLMKGRRDVGSLTISLLLAILPALPYLLFRWTFLEVTNPAYLDFTEIAPNEIRLTPHLFYKLPQSLSCPEHYGPQPTRCQNPFLAVAFLLSPFLLSVLKDRRAIFLFSNMIGPPFFMLNPLFVPLLCRFIHFDLVLRFGQLFPFLLVPLFFLERFLSTRRGGEVRWLEKGMAVASLLLVLSLPLVRAQWLDPLKLRQEASRQLHLYYPEKGRIEPVLAVLNRQLGESSVILSSPSIGLAVVAYTKYYIVVGQGIHVSAAARDQLEREKDVSLIVNEPWAKGKGKIITKYHVDYLLLDKTTTEPKILKSLLGAFDPFCEEGDFIVLGRKVLLDG